MQGRTKQHCSTSKDACFTAPTPQHPPVLYLRHSGVASSAVHYHKSVETTASCGSARLYITQKIREGHTTRANTVAYLHYTCGQIGTVHRTAAKRGRASKCAPSECPGTTHSSLLFEAAVLPFRLEPGVSQKARQLQNNCMNLTDLAFLLSTPSISTSTQHSSDKLLLPSGPHTTVDSTTLFPIIHWACYPLFPMQHLGRTSWVAATK